MSIVRLSAVAFAALTLAAMGGCASRPAGAQTPSGPATLTGAWTFDFDAGPGVATATLRAANGAPLATIQCQAPRGPVDITDWQLPTNGARAPMARLSLGSRDALTTGFSPSPSASTGLRFGLQPADPVFQAISAGAPVTIGVVGGKTHTWPADSALQFNTVLNACVSRGS